MARDVLSTLPSASLLLKTRFIVNPRSGRALRGLPAVRAFATQHGADVVFTERPRHASEIAAASLREGYDLIAAVGGDGTLNEVASVLVGTGAIFGLVPCGSGDGLGRHLGIHGSVPHALNVLKTGRPRLIDTGLADGHPFFTAAGIGFEAHIAEQFNRLQRRGFLRYLTTSARALRNWPPQTATITDEHGRHDVRFFTLAVANSNQYGNNAIIAPDGRADDGLLDLCAVPPVSWLNALPLVVRLFNGTLARQRGIVQRRGARFVVERSAPGPLHTDGELHDAGRVIEFSIRPASLRIMAPARARPA